MACRNLTDVFTLMRNNAVQSRHFYNEQRINDRAALVDESLSRNDVEIGSPPLWSDQLEECQYAITRLNSKIYDLGTLHERCLQRPQAFSDSSEDHHQVEILTKEIARMFVNCHKLVESIKMQSNIGSGTEKRLAINAISSLASSLQAASITFKTTQNKYIKRLNMREQQTSQFMQELDTGQEDTELDHIDLAFASGTHQQLLMLEEENSRIAQQRQEEVQRIMQSIFELNDIFKDLAHMISEQGTVLDRIDYNLERSSVQIHQGFQQLQKAERYQRKNRKMMCILCLASVTSLLFILLVAVKF